MFVKGDPRINRKGRPKKGDTARKLLEEFSAEECTYNGVVMPKYKAVMLSVIDGAIKGDTQDKRLFFEYVYGKPVQQVEASISASDLPDNELSEKIEERYRALKARQNGVDNVQRN